MENREEAGVGDEEGDDLERGMEAGASAGSEAHTGSRVEEG